MSREIRGLYTLQRSGAVVYFFSKSSLDNDDEILVEYDCFIFF